MKGVTPSLSVFKDTKGTLGTDKIWRADGAGCMAQARQVVAVPDSLCMYWRA